MMAGRPASPSRPLELELEHAAIEEDPSSIPKRDGPGPRTRRAADPNGAVALNGGLDVTSVNTHVSFGVDGDLVIARTLSQDNGPGGHVSGPSQ